MYKNTSSIELNSIVEPPDSHSEKREGGSMLFRKCKKPRSFLGGSFMGEEEESISPIKRKHTDITFNLKKEAKNAHTKVHENVLKNTPSFFHKKTNQLHSDTSTSCTTYLDQATKYRIHPWLKTSYIPEDYKNGMYSTFTSFKRKSPNPSCGNCSSTPHSGIRSSRNTFLNPMERCDILRQEERNSYSDALVSARKSHKRTIYDDEHQHWGGEMSGRVSIRPTSSHSQRNRSSIGYSSRPTPIQSARTFTSMGNRSVISSVSALSHTTSRTTTSEAQICSVYERFKKERERKKNEKKKREEMKIEEKYIKENPDLYHPHHQIQLLKLFDYRENECHHNRNGEEIHKNEDMISVRAVHE